MGLDRVGRFESLTRLDDRDEFCDNWELPSTIARERHRGPILGRVASGIATDESEWGAGDPFCFADKSDVGPMGDPQQRTWDVDLANSLTRGTAYLVALALPITIVQVGMMLMGVVDTMMVGRVSETALAAVAVGNLVFFGAIAYGLGVIMGLDPVLAQAFGAKDRVGMTRGLQRGLLMAVGLTVPTAIVLGMAQPLLHFAEQPADVIPVAARYAWISIPGVLPFFVFLVFRQTLQVLGELRTIVAIIFFANGLNVLLNGLLIFGYGEFNGLGALGSAWASTASRWILAIGLLACSWRHLRPHLFPWHRESLGREGLLRLLKLGTPVGIQVFLEFGAFAVIALLMGWLGAREIAAHQIAINLASLTFMMPLGISGAASVLVGRAIGAGDMPAAQLCNPLTVEWRGRDVIGFDSALHPALPLGSALYESGGCDRHCRVVDSHGRHLSSV